MHLIFYANSACNNFRLRLHYFEIFEVDNLGTEATSKFIFLSYQ